MQNLPVYLYANIFDITLDFDPTIRGVNRVMYQRDLKIQKGLKNQIRVQFKNSDQKRIHIYNTQTFVFSMFDAISNRLILEKELQVLDTATTATRGLALLTLNESDTIDLDKTSYQYSVKMKEEGQYGFSPTYSNTYYGVNGTLHLLTDVFPVLKDSTSIQNFAKHWDDVNQRYEYNSGNVYANPEYSGVTALHTAAVYMTSYRGAVVIQATLSNDPSDNSSYATVETRQYNSFSGIDYINFNGIFSYIRIKYIPSTAPAESTNDNPAYFGSVDKVLYRN